MKAIGLGIAAGWLAAALGCARSEQPATDGADPSHAVPADSLVLSLPSGHTVWLAEGRAATDSAGAGCTERSVEIRTDTATVKVPLLFVVEPPTVLDRDHLRAELSRHCRVMAVYRVELATGRPYKLEDR
ncbi:MAG: hypothetical protein ACYC2K_06075 [Gemmatimonadales bacterium]